MADITIADIRQKYPQYADLSDQQLADSLHQKYYNDMPIADFYKKINFKQSSSKSDEAPKSSIAHAFSKAFGQTEDFGKYLPSHPVSDLKDVVQGVIEGLVAAPQNLFRAESSVFPDKLLNNSYVQAIRNKDWAKATAPIGSGREGFGPDYLRGIGQFLPVSGLEGDVQEALAKLLPNAAEEIPKVAVRLGIGAAGGLATPEKNPDDVTKDMLWSSLLNALIPGAGDATSSFLEKRRPSVKLRGTLSPAELQQNLETARGTQTALGDVIQSTKLKKKYENVISKLPFSDAVDRMKKILVKLNNQGNNILEKILGSLKPDVINKNVDKAGENAIKSVFNIDNIKDTEGQLNEQGKDILRKVLDTDNLIDTNGQLSDEGHQILEKLYGANLNPETAINDFIKHLNKNYNEQDIAKGPLYRQRNKIAQEDKKFKMQSPLFAQTAKKYADSIKATKFLKLDPDRASIYNKAEQYKTSNTKQPGKESYIDDAGIIHFEQKPEKPKEPLSLHEAQILKGYLNELAAVASKSSDASQRGAEKIFKSLAANLGKDIDNSIKKSGNKELLAAHEKANSNYIKNYLPFLNKNIFKLINGKIDPDTVLSHLIKTGPKSDRATLLQSATALPGNMRPPLGKAYFSRAFKNGKVDPDILSKLITDLGPNQLRELVPNEAERQSLLDYVNKTKLNKKLGKSLHQNGKMDNKGLAEIADEFDKNPVEAIELIPSRETRNELSNYGENYRSLKVFDSALNQDGSVNVDKLEKTIDSLTENPQKFDEIVPNKAAQNKLKNFSTYKKRIDHFKPALKDGQVNLAKLASLGKELRESPDEYNKYLPKEVQDDLNKFINIQTMNKSVPDVLANQPTGKTNLDWAGIITAAIPVLMGAGSGHIIEGLAGSAAATGAMGAIGHVLTNKMTSEKAREALIKLMLENKTKFKAGGPLTKAAQISAMSAATSGGR